MFQQLIFNERIQPFEQPFANSFAQQLLTDRSIQSFTFDHKKQKNKLCFGEVIEKPREISRNHKALVIYTDDYFKGIRHQDYQHAVSRLTFYRQKISNIQEIDPLNSEKKNIFQEKELPKITIGIRDELQQSRQHRHHARNANQQLATHILRQKEYITQLKYKRDMCEDCALYDYSDQLTKYKLGRIQAKREQKGEKYEIKLQKFYEKTLKELKYQNQVVLNANAKNE